MEVRIFFKVCFYFFNQTFFKNIFNKILNQFTIFQHFQVKNNKQKFRHRHSRLLGRWYTKSERRGRCWSEPSSTVPNENREGRFETGRRLFWGFQLCANEQGRLPVWREAPGRPGRIQNDHHSWPVGFFWRVCRFAGMERHEYFSLKSLEISHNLWLINYVS